MKIAVLYYTIASVDIFDAPDFETTEEVEDYLANEKGYNLDDIYYMADVQSINIE